MSKADQSDATSENLGCEFYLDLRAMANQRLAKNSLRNDISPTSLLHESILKCGGWKELSAQKSKQMIQCQMAYAMRSVLVDRARRRRVEQDFLRQVLVSNCILCDSSSEDLVERLDHALSGLSLISPESSKIVHLKFFLNYSFLEIAALLDVSERTVRRYWSYGRSWLKVEMNHE